MSRRYLTAAVLRELDTQLTEHDRTVLRTISDLRFVSGDQLTRLHFGSDQASARAARRALVRLTRQGVLERLPRTVGGARRGSSGFVYRLGSAGQSLAARRGWQPARRHQSHVPGTLFLRHALQVAELHTLLVEAERAGHIELLSLEAEPACHRPSGGFTLKPDSYVELGAGDFVDSYFIEIDRGTEGSRALDTQLRRYVAYHDSGIEQRERGVFPRTLWLAPDAPRRQTIEDCIGRLPARQHELFAVAQFADAMQMLDDVGTTAYTYK